MKRFGNFIASTVVVVVATTIVFVLANFAFLAFFHFYPGALEPEAEGITREFNDRFIAEQGSHAMEWLALDSTDELQAFSVENTERSITGATYRDFAHSEGCPEVRGRAAGKLKCILLRRLDNDGSRTGWATLPSYF